MPDTPSIIYWGSCVFLSYVNGYPERIPTLEALLERSARGEFELYTSIVDARICEPYTPQPRML